MALLFAVVPTIASIAPSVVTTDLFIVGEDEPISEDVYVASTSGRVEGVVDGDLVIMTGDLSISGTVRGNVLALTSGVVHVEKGAVVEGSVRAAGPQVQIDGEVGGDLFATGIAAAVGSTGIVQRDVIVFGGTLTLDGEVGRDVRGRLLSADVSGTVGRDVDLAVERLVVHPGARISGDVLYRSATPAVIASGTVEGQVVALPAQSNFIFGVILTLANIVGFLAFIVAGIMILWLFRGTGSAAVEAVERHPLKTLLIGFGSLVGAPILILLLVATLVGLPLAALLLVALLLAFVFGPIPAVGAAGDVLLRRKGGLFGGFVVGAILWRLGIWLIPIVGSLLYLVGLIWGVGGWVLAGWQIRRARPVTRDALPSSMFVKDDEEIPDDWEYPLPPPSPSPSVLAGATTPSTGDTRPADEAVAADVPDTAGDRPAGAGEPASDGGDEDPDATSGTDDWGLPTR